MSKRKIYIVGGGSEYANWTESKEVFKMEDADLVLFTGGEDVDPSLYNRKSHPTTSSNLYRDKKEKSAFEQAKDLDKPMLGICRGSQLLCVLNGGILVQHQDNPAYIHKMHMHDGKDILISSTHHQAAFPYVMPADKYKILGWTNGISDFHYGQSWLEELNPPRECEVVYYSENRCLGIQGHPELLYNREGGEPSITYLRGLLDKHMSNQI